MNPRSDEPDAVHENGQPFAGHIGRTFRDSRPWWPERVRAPQGAPDVVFIVLDDVGFSDLGCYGSEIATPAMDRLAAGGLRYNNFHVTAMCSPTRACLLTGRNAHASGVGIITEWGGGYPGYRGRMAKSTATLAEILGANGYHCAAVGKWHLTPNADFTAAGPFDDWPTGRGFHRWYGFHGSLTDHWHPELFEDNHPIEPPREAGYHLSEDLVEHAIGQVRDHLSAAPATPYFMYLAFGACHFPHHAPREFIERYRGRYDAGWDVIRAERFARQQAMGIIPKGTTLAPRNPDVTAWEDLSADARLVSARLQEVYAAFLEHTDTQIGRFLDFLAASVRIDNTLIVLLSDNGASAEGGQTGAWHHRKHVVYDPESLTDALAALDRLGSQDAFNHYPAGWAQVSNTPLKWYKKDTHGGGIRAPLLIHCPARIPDGGAIRSQYHHVIDVAATIAELLPIDVPVSYRGVEQIPLQGVSMKYTFKDHSAPTRKHIQHFELLGDRALWKDGWKAVSRHRKGDDFDADRWELYYLDADFSECNDLAAMHPQALRALIDLWWEEARANSVLPLDDRDWERAAERRAATVAPKRYTYYPGMARIDRLSAPNLTGRSYRIFADLAGIAADAQGVIVAFGSKFTGYVLYVRERRLVYEYAYSERTRHVLAAGRELPAGPCTVEYRFDAAGEGAGHGCLLIDGEPAGSIDIPETWPLRAATGGLHCGADHGPGIGSGYVAPFAFSGSLQRVVFELA